MPFTFVSGTTTNLPGVPVNHVSCTILKVFKGMETPVTGFIFSGDVRCFCLTFLFFSFLSESDFIKEPCPDCIKFPGGGRRHASDSYLKRGCNKWIFSNGFYRIRNDFLIFVKKLCCIQFYPAGERVFYPGYKNPSAYFLRDFYS